MSEYGESQELIKQFRSKETDTRRGSKAGARSEGSKDKIREIYGENGSTEKGNRVNNSLKDGVDVSPQRTFECLDAVEAVQKGKKGEAERAEIQTEIDEVRRLRDMFEWQKM